MKSRLDPALPHEAAHATVAAFLDLPVHSIEVDRYSGMGVCEGGRCVYSYHYGQELQACAAMFAGYLQNRRDGLSSSSARKRAHDDFEHVKRLGLQPAQVRQAIKMAHRILRQKQKLIRATAKRLRGRKTPMPGADFMGLAWSFA
jgi:hypothetical protein